jgi:uncharacterized protein YjbI with pentapeptide repeats
VKPKVVIAAAVVAVALIATAVPASAGPADPSTAVVNAAKATGGDTGAPQVPANFSIEAFLKAKGPEIAKDVAKNAGLFALKYGFNYVAKLAGFDLSGNAELYKRLDALKAELDEIKLQIDQVQVSVNGLAADIADQNVKTLYAQAQLQFTTIVTGFRGSYLSLVDANKAYYEAYIAANGDLNAQTVKNADDELVKARKKFYEDFGNTTAKGVWRNIHNVLVGTSNTDSIITAKGALIAKQKRYLTAADSLDLRNLYFGLQAEEALAYNMAAEASVPCAGPTDCAKFAGAPGVPTDDGDLKRGVVDYHNAAVDEARMLPPMIPVGSVVDNRGGGSTNGKQEWIVQNEAAPTFVEQSGDLGVLNQIVTTAVDPQDIDGQPTGGYALPSKQQLADFVTIDPTAGGNRGFPNNGTVTVNQWLSSLDTSPNWQAIATRNSPRITANSTEDWTLRCTINPQSAEVKPNTVKRQSTVAMQSDKTTVSFASARPADGNNGGYYIKVPPLSNGAIEHPAQADECTYLANQRAAASPGKQILATRTIPKMPQDYMAQNRTGVYVSDVTDLSYQNFASLNLGLRVDDKGVPFRNEDGFWKTDLTGAFLQNAILTGTNLDEAELRGAVLTGVVSGGITGTPNSLPDGWKLINGFLVGPGADLTSADLKGADLSGMDLTGVILTGAKLDGANLTGTKLAGVQSGGISGTPTLPAGWSLVNGALIGQGANLHGVSLRNQDLSNVDLRNVQSGDVDCRGCVLPTGWRYVALPDGTSGFLVGPTADLTNADLTDFDLSGVDLSNATLTGVVSLRTNCTGCTLPAGWRWTGSSTGYLAGPGADLTGADLRNLDLSGVDLTNATLTSVRFRSADLTGVTLTGAEVTKTDFSGATLVGVRSGGLRFVAGKEPSLPTNWRLIGGYLIGPRANLHDADLSGLDLKDAKLSGADLRGVKLTGTTSGGVDCTNCQLDVGRVWTGSTSGYLVGPGANLVNAALGTADLTTVDFTDVRSGGVTGTPTLPTGTSKYLLIKGYIVGPRVNLAGANLNGADLRSAQLDFVTSGGVTGSPQLPNGWRLVNGYLIGPKADLTGAVLPGTILETIDMSGARLSKANLFGANLAGATLNGATLTNANLGGTRMTAGYSAIVRAQTNPNILPPVNLNGADLTGTNLSGADLTSVVSGATVGTPKLPTDWRAINGYLVGPGATLISADLDGADLSGMRLQGVNLTNAHLTLAKLTNVNFTNLAAVWEYNASNSPINVLKTTLAGATLTGVQSGGILGSPPLTSGWKLVNGYLVGIAANLTGANLAGANLTSMSLTGANFTDANLTNVIFTNAQLVQTRFIGATITGATFLTDNDNKLAGMLSGGLKGQPKALPVSNRFRIVEGYFVGPSANLTGAVFSPAANLGVSLSGTNFTDATLAGIKFIGATLVNTNFTDANLRDTNIEGADMSNARLVGVSSGGVTGHALLPPNWKLIDGYLVGPHANLRDAILINDDLTGVNLSGADLTGADIGTATLIGVVWSNTICPNGVEQSTPCAPLTRPRTTVSVSTTANSDALLVDIGPDLAKGDWTFTVEQRLADGEWQDVGSSSSNGPQETRTVNLAAGTYRVVVDPQLGYFGSESVAVTLTR